MFSKYMYRFLALQEIIICGPHFFYQYHFHTPFAHSVLFLSLHLIHLYKLLYTTAWFSSTHFVWVEIPHLKGIQFTWNFFLSQLTMDDVDHLCVTTVIGSGWLQWMCSFFKIMFTFIPPWFQNTIFFCVYSKSTLCRIHCLSAGFLCRVILWSKNISFLLLSFPFYLRCGIFLIFCMLQYAGGHVCGPDGQMRHFLNINYITLAITCLTVLCHPQH